MISFGKLKKSRKGGLDGTSFCSSPSQSVSSPLSSASSSSSSPAYSATTYTVPKPAELAQRLATPPAPPPPPHQNNKPNTSDLEAIGIDPYDDLSLYTRQINAVHPTGPRARENVPYSAKSNRAAQEVAYGRRDAPCFPRPYEESQMIYGTLDANLLRRHDNEQQRHQASYSASLPRNSSPRVSSDHRYNLRENPPLTSGYYGYNNKAPTSSVQPVSSFSLYDRNDAPVKYKSKMTHAVNKYGKPNESETQFHFHTQGMDSSSSEGDRVALRPLYSSPTTTVAITTVITPGIMVSESQFPPRSGHDKSSMDGPRDVRFTHGQKNQVPRPLFLPVKTTGERVYLRADDNLSPVVFNERPRHETPGLPESSLSYESAGRMRHPQVMTSSIPFGHRIANDSSGRSSSESPIRGRPSKQDHVPVHSSNGSVDTRFTLRSHSESPLPSYKEGNPTDSFHSSSSNKQAAFTPSSEDHRAFDYDNYNFYPESQPTKKGNDLHSTRSRHKKPSGLASVLKYHEQLRKELSMPPPISTQQQQHHQQQQQQSHYEVSHHPSSSNSAYSSPFYPFASSTAASPSSLYPSHFHQPHYSTKPICTLASSAGKVSVTETTDTKPTPGFYTTEHSMSLSRKKSEKLQDLHIDQKYYNGTNQDFAPTSYPASPTSPPAKYGMDYLTSIAYDGKSRAFHEAYQNLHGHYSTPHLPSAILASMDQPLSGSDPNIRGEPDGSRSSGYFVYDNVLMPPARKNHQYHGFDLYDGLGSREPLQKSSPSLYSYSESNQRARPDLSSISTPSLAAPPSSSSASMAPQLQYNRSNNEGHRTHLQHILSFTSASSPPPTSLPQSSSSHSQHRPTEFQFPPASSAVPQKPSTQAGGDRHNMTIPRNFHSNASRFHHSTAPQSGYYTLQQREPSYEEIANIVPYSQQIDGKPKISQRAKSPETPTNAISINRPSTSSAFARLFPQPSTSASQINEPPYQIDRHSGQNTIPSTPAALQRFHIIPSIATTSTAALVHTPYPKSDPFSPFNPSHQETFSSSPASDIPRSCHSDRVAHSGSKDPRTRAEQVKGPSHAQKTHLEISRDFKSERDDKWTRESDPSSEKSKVMTSSPQSNIGCEMTEDEFISRLFKRKTDRHRHLSSTSDHALPSFASSSPSISPSSASRHNTSAPETTSSPLTSCDVRLRNGRKSDPDEIALSGDRKRVTSSPENIGSVVDDVMEDYLMTYPYHLYSRRKKPLPDKKLPTTVSGSLPATDTKSDTKIPGSMMGNYFRVREELGEKKGADVTKAADTDPYKTPNNDMMIPETDKKRGRLASDDKTNANPATSTTAAPSTPNSLQQQQQLEQQEHHQHSQSMPQQSKNKSPDTSSSPAVDNENFINKICKFEMISRGKSSSLKSPSQKSPASMGQSPQESKFVYPNQPHPQPFMGEKIFTRDTATTRISASLLQGLNTDRVPSTVSTVSSNSLTSVSTLSWSSDLSESSGSSRGRKARSGGSGRGSGGGQAADVGSATDVKLSPSPSLPNGYDESEDGSTPLASPREPDLSDPTNSGVFKGLIDLRGPNSPSVVIDQTSILNTQNRQQRSQRQSTKKFVTLSSPNTEDNPTPVVTPLPRMNRSPGSGSMDSRSRTSSRGSDSSTGLNINGPCATNALNTSGSSQPNRDSTTTNSSNSSGSQAGSHRNTFEGIDFDLSDLTGEQKELALKHREVVAERKMEQEREREERQRLEEILRMCEDYQNEVGSEVTGAQQGHAMSPGPLPFASSSTQYVMSPSFSSSTTSTILSSSASDQRTPRHPPPTYLPLSPTSPSSSPSSEAIVSSGNTITAVTHSNTTGVLVPSSSSSSPPSATSSPCNSLERRERGAVVALVGNMTKIKTNGSLMLNSPSNPHKDGSPFTFQSPVTLRKAVSSSSTYSSNSEDENPESSEDTGTIKKRPTLTSPHFNPTPFHPSGDVSNKSQLPPSSDSLAASTSSHHPQSPDGAITPATILSHQVPYSSPSFSDDTASPESTANVPKGSAAQETFVQGFPTSQRQGIPTEGNRLDIRDVDNDNVFLSDTSDESGHKERFQSPVAHSEPENVQPYQFSRVSSTDEKMGRTSSASSTHSFSKVLNSDPDSPDSSAKAAFSSTSSSQTITGGLDQSSRSASCSSGVAMDAKEDTPTPVNSDTEQGECQSPSSSHQLSPIASVDSPVDMRGTSLSAKEQCQLRGHLEGLKLTKAQLLVRIAELKRKVSEIEIQEGEAVRELDLETKLLEGEHKDQMAQFQQDQERITDMKQRQKERLDVAVKERENQQRIIELERQKLLALEEQQHQLNARILRSTSSSSDVSSNSSSNNNNEEEMLAMRARLSHELDRQRRLFDDLEFQQLEAEARFESEKEQLSSRVLMEETELLNKYKFREERLQQIDIQQKDMLARVKATLERYQAQRQLIVESYKKEKSKIAHCDKRIADISKVLCVPVQVEKTDSDGEGESPMEGGALVSPIPLSPDSPSYPYFKGSSFLDSSVGSVEFRPHLDLSLDSSSASSSSGPVNGSLIIDQERKRIEELRRRAADEGRAQWEERRRAGDESRLQLEERRLREANCKSFNSLESEDSSIASSCETPSEKEISSSLSEETTKSLTEDREHMREEALAPPLVALYDMDGEMWQWAYSTSSQLRNPAPTRGYPDSPRCFKTPGESWEDVC